MVIELTIGTGIAIVIIAFIAEYIDSSLGMGYGSSLSPILLLFGFEPLQIIPAILLSELITGVFAGMAHNYMGNVSFKLNLKEIIKKSGEIGYIESFRQNISLHLKIVLTIVLYGILGPLIAAFIAINLPPFFLKLYIGILISIMGIIILVTLHRKYSFSWKKITALGCLASFNKTMTGGGYGSVVTGGQIVSGINGKNAIGITSLAEGLICLGGVSAYILTNSIIDWTLVPYLLIGAVCSVPLSAYTVKRVKTEKMRVIIGFAILFLGILTLVNVLF